MNTNIQDDDRRPDQIEQDIERTRAEVSSTIDAIQSKLTPSEMADQVWQYVRENGTGEFGRNLSRSVRENPMPVALIGIGVAWMMLGGGRRSGTSSNLSDTLSTRRTYRSDADLGTAGLGMDADVGSPYETGSSGTSWSSGSPSDGRMGTSQPGIGERVRGAVSSTADRVRESVSSATQRVRGTTSSTGDKARDLASTAGDRLGGLSQSAKMRAGALQQTTRDQYYRARQRTTELVDEQPLVIGALGVAVGAALGALLPTTRRENELLGEMRDQVVGEASRVAGEQMETVKEVASRVAQTAKEEVGRAMESPPPTGAGATVGGNGTGSRAPI
jgi:ElaB/YqjD/DUF883 family membrane-anchored ribosome-binding protein